MGVGVLFSGGKDSCYTVWLLQHQAWDVPVLLTMKPTNPESMMFHYPGIEWTSLQAEAMGIPQILVETKNGELDELRDSLVKARKDYGIEGLATGAVASDYQKTRIDNLCESASIKSYSPLWHKDPKTIVEDLKQTGFQVMIIAIAAAGFDQSWLGRILDEDGWKKLQQLSDRFKLHLAGEGGEYETFVLDAPHFQKRVQIERSTPVWDGQSGRLVIERASLVNKFSDRSPDSVQYVPHVQGQ